MSTCSDIITNFTDHYGPSYTSFRFFVNNVLCNGLVGFGMISNVMTILVFATNRHLSSRPLVHYFITLAVFDFVVLGGKWLQIPWKVFNLQPILGDHVYAIYAGLVVSNTAITACIWCTIFVTAERYLSLCHPLQHRLIAERTARQIYILVFITVSASLYCIPLWFELQFDECVDQNTQKIVIVLLPTWLLQSTRYMIGYRLVGGLLFHSLGPFILLAVMSVLIARNLKNAVDFRLQFRSTASSSSPVETDADANDEAEGNSARRSLSFQMITLMSAEEQRMIIMQIVITIQFLLCYCRNSKTSTIQKLK